MDRPTFTAGGNHAGGNGVWEFMATMALAGMSDRGPASGSWRSQHAAAPLLRNSGEQAHGAGLSAAAEFSSEPTSGLAFPGSGNHVPARGIDGAPSTPAPIGQLQALNALALRCAAGDAAAWNELARTQHRRIYAMCFRFTGSGSEAEDLTQEVFLKMYRVIGTFDPARGAFSTWLTALTRNLLVDHYRRSRLTRATDSLDVPASPGDEDSPTRAERLPSPGRSQEQQVAGMELRAHIQQALKQVSPELREAVILRDLEDMDYKDIAEVLGVPQGTVKSRISRGRADLARLLKRMEGQVI